EHEVAGDLKTRKENNQDASGPVPVELVTTSGSGLDPHLSPQGAFWQVPRIAKAREVSPERGRAVIDSSIEGRTFGILGEPRVNVLLVNLALDRQFGQPAPLPVPEKKDTKDTAKDSSPSDHRPTPNPSQEKESEVGLRRKSKLSLSPSSSTRS